MKRDIKLYVKDILKAIDAIEKFVKDIDFEEFRKNDMVFSAVIRKFEIIGEASKHIPEEIRQKYTDIPWKEMASFRDKLIHFYFGIKHELVWNTIEYELPKLKTRIERILSEI